MCFVIQENPEVPKNKYVYKVARIEGERLVSPLRSLFRWYPGVFASKGKTVTWRRQWGKDKPVPVATAGIYVYLSKRAARRSAWHTSTNSVILKLRVKPKDFLHKAAEPYIGEATYRKVELREEDQSEVEFYA